MKTQIIYMMTAMLVFAAAGCSGKKQLGVKDGLLTPCPSSPNCVSSQANDSHKIDAIAYKCSRAEARSILIEVIKGIKRANIVEDKEDYVYSVFTSVLFRFKDDVEFYFPKDKNIIHVRSASRIGYSDLGVNKNRIKKIRELFAEKESMLNKK